MFLSKRAAETEDSLVGARPAGDQSQHPHQAKKAGTRPEVESGRAPTLVA